MATSNSTRRASATKPAKPSKTFPLFAHACGKWAIKRCGRMFYFGTWDDPKAALREYFDIQDAIDAGHDPRKSKRVAGLTIKMLGDRYMTFKKSQVTAGELSPRTYADCLYCCRRVADHFGRTRPVVSIAPDDFLEYRQWFAKGRSPVSLSNEVLRVRSFFKFGRDYRLIDEPVDFGPGFVPPPRKIVRLHKQQKEQKNGKRLFEASTILASLDEAGVHLRAMILLGINCGFGNSDCGNLPISAVDLEAGWIDFPRPKTSVERRAPLWPETVEALRESLARRPKPASPDLEHRFFLTPRGRDWTLQQSSTGISKKFSDVLRGLGEYRDRVSFYTLRHSFATIGSQIGDEAAMRALMGHADRSMLAEYTHELANERLTCVTSHVRDWLYNK